MKRTVFVIRFGSHKPLPKEFPIVEQIADGELEKAMGTSIGQIGVLSIFNTAMPVKEIERLFTQCALDTDDVLPVVVFEADSQEQCAFNLSAFPNFDEAYAEFKKANSIESEPIPATKNGITLSLDQLLDLVKEKGIAGLTTEEKTQLDRLSQQ